MKYYVKFYAYSLKYNRSNYLFSFRVQNKRAAVKAAKNFGAKAAWFQAVQAGRVVLNERLF